jgi:hypothetical protein
MNQIIPTERNDMDKAIIERIKTLKSNYRFEIIKEVVTDKIAYGINMALDPSGMLYVSARDARTLLVFDADLNEICSFEQRSLSTGMALTDTYLITAHWQENIITIYDKKGNFIRSVDTEKEIIPNMIPGLIGIGGGRVIFSDLRSNTIFRARIHEDSSISIDKKITIKEKRFYDPDTNTWYDLRALVECDGQLYVTGGGALLMVGDDGVLTEKERIPFETRAIMGMVFHKNVWCIVDSSNNRVSVWGSGGKRYSLPLGNEENFRLCATAECLYFLKNLSGGKISITQVEIGG